jgi:hypothetical protein
VRGAIADPCRTQDVRRLVHHDRKTGDAPTLCDVPKRWLALDIDGIPRPPDIAATDLRKCGPVVIGVLPAPFRHARCIVQATASHGIKPGIRLRLWYWLDRPTAGIELKCWLRAAPVDPSVFGAAQAIYTAAPLFVSGALDPLPERLIIVADGAAEVRVPRLAAAAPTAHKKAATAPRDYAAGGTRYAAAALRSATARVARAGEGARHSTLLSEAVGLARLVARGLLSANLVIRALGGAAEMVGLPATEAGDAIAWALAHPRGDTPGAIR